MIEDKQTDNKVDFNISEISEAIQKAFESQCKLLTKEERYEAFRINCEARTMKRSGNIFREFNRNEITDKIIANEFAITMNNILRFNSSAKSWYYCDGTDGVWREDENNVLAMAVVGDFIKQLKENLESHELSSDMKTLIRKSLTKCEYKSRIDNILSLAKGEVNKQIRDEDFDKELNVINAANGVIVTSKNRCGEFIPHSIKTNDFLFSKVLGTDYNGNIVKENKMSEEDFNKYFEAYTLWNTFIAEVCRDRNENGEWVENTEKEEFLQKYLGYGLLGKAPEKKMIFIWGKTTNNGKSVLASVLKAVYGDYCEILNPLTFAEKKFANGSAPSPDKAKINGARFVIVGENERSMRMDAQFFKSITGGTDYMTERKLQHEPITFKVNCKVMFHTNYLPIINDDACFDSDRINVIEFNRHFTEDEQDKSLIDKLTTDESKKAILNWLIDGLIKYHKEGLKAPKCIREATERYKNKSNEIREFFQEYTEDGEPSEFITANMLYPYFQEYTKAAAIPTLTLREFIKALKVQYPEIKDEATINGNKEHNVIRGRRIKA